MEIIFFIIGLIIGGMITFFIANYYYGRARKGLKNEVTKLRELNIRILWKMEQEGLIEWSRDSQGNIVGLDIKSKSKSIVDQKTVENRTLH